MRRVEAIRTAPLFRACIGRIEEAETDREFCRHGMPHLLDVARIAWIDNLELGLGLDREVVYAAALLHDIGRAEQYSTGEDHDVAGARVAAEILDGLPEGLQFDAGERLAILSAVSGHRGACAGEGAIAVPCVAEVPTGADGVQGSVGEMHRGSTHRGERTGSLVRLIKEADNRSRACYACPARGGCHWPDERKNLSMDI